MVYTTGNAHIGRQRMSGGSNYFQGCIDDLRIYSGALTETEVRALIPNWSEAACTWYCGSTTNMDTYTVGAAYVIGGTYQGTVGISAPNVGAVIAGYLGQLTFPIWGQQGLVNVGTPEVMGLPSGLGTSPIMISWPVPNEHAYVGFHVYTQAAGFGGGQINLTCAYDCTVGY